MRSPRGCRRPNSPSCSTSITISPTSTPSSIECSARLTDVSLGQLAGADGNLSAMMAAGDRMADQVTSAEDVRVEPAAEPVPGDVRIQPGGFLLELSLDWLVLRASENIHRLLDESHVAVVGEPLGKFVHSQALHDLRNLFSRLSGTTGIARAYGVRLTDETSLFDIAFQVSDGRLILEAVPSDGRGFGEAFGTVAGLIAGLASSRGQ